MLQFTLYSENAPGRDLLNVCCSLVFDMIYVLSPQVEISFERLPFSQFNWFNSTTVFNICWFGANLNSPFITCSAGQLTGQANDIKQPTTKTTPKTTRQDNRERVLQLPGNQKADDLRQHTDQDKEPHQKKSSQLGAAQANNHRPNQTESAKLLKHARKQETRKQPRDQSFREQPSIANRATMNQLHPSDLLAVSCCQLEYLFTLVQTGFHANLASLQARQSSNRPTDQPVKQPTSYIITICMLLNQQQLPKISKDHQQIVY